MNQSSDSLIFEMMLYLESCMEIRFKINDQRLTIFDCRLRNTPLIVNHQSLIINRRRLNRGIRQ